VKLWRAPSSLRSHSHPHAALTLPRPPLPYLVLAWEVWSSHFPAPPPSAFSSPSPHLPRCSPSSWPSFTRASESRPYLIPLPLLSLHFALVGNGLPRHHPLPALFPHSSHPPCRSSLHPPNSLSLSPFCRSSHSPLFLSPCHRLSLRPRLLTLLDLLPPIALSTCQPPHRTRYACPLLAFAF